MCAAAFAVFTAAQLTLDDALLCPGQQGLAIGQRQVQSLVGRLVRKFHNASWPSCHAYLLGLAQEAQ